MVWRPFYFANLIVDPKNPDRLFKPDLNLIQSRTAARASPTSAAARTAIITTSGSIRPNPKHVITGDDGGLWQSYDGGNKWWKQNNLPVSQFYHVSVDNDGSVPGLRRPAGQQLVGRRQRVSGRHHQLALGKHVRRRRLLDVRRSGRSELHLRRMPGRLRSAASTARRMSVARIQPKAELQRETALELEHADRAVAEREGHDLHRRAVPVPLARSRPELGAHLAGSHDERSGEAEAGRIGRRHRRQLGRRDAHDDLFDQRIAEERRT